MEVAPSPELHIEFCYSPLPPEDVHWYSYRAAFDVKGLLGLQRGLPLVPPLAPLPLPLPLLQTELPGSGGQPKKKVYSYLMQICVYLQI